MSKLDDDIAGSTPTPSPNKRPPRERRVITGSGALVAGNATVAGDGNVTVQISKPATLSLTTYPPTVVVGPAKRPVDAVSEFADRWLKLLLPANVYRVVEQVIADWQHECDAADSKLRWWINVKNGLHLLWVLVRLLLFFLWM